MVVGDTSVHHQALYHGQDHGDLFYLAPVDGLCRRSRLSGTRTPPFMDGGGVSFPRSPLIVVPSGLRLLVLPEDAAGFVLKSGMVMRLGLRPKAIDVSLKFLQPLSFYDRSSATIFRLFDCSYLESIKWAYALS
ncbi:hypothetical protein L6452_21884 [Arctium lappa]|uniref:Uncharacterized protein n=1 Tax=Arctium lappa TaxID=4217 RepID=A0ACB9AXE7_ARCLA|nr:hypothetical protein L6452_21884 [Arctium lappa]